MGVWNKSVNDYRSCEYRFGSWSNSAPVVIVVGWLIRLLRDLLQISSLVAGRRLVSLGRESQAGRGNIRETSKLP
jgi:hypothetical protein